MREHIAVHFMVLIGTLAIKKKKAQALYQFCYRCSEFQVLHQALKCVGSAAHSLVSNVSPVPNHYKSCRALCSACNIRDAVLIVTPTRLFILLMCLQTSSLRKYTIDDFLPTWLNIFQDVTRSAWENEWKTAGDSSVPCCGCFLTLLVKSNDSISFLQSQTQVTYSVNFYFSQHTRETCTVREIAYCLREKVIAFAGRQQCTCYMLKQNCHFHCKYAFMWSGVYQHLNWELEMWRLLLCVTHFCSFFTKKKKMKYTYACVSVSCFLSESLHVILNKKKKYYGCEQDV